MRSAQRQHEPATQSPSACCWRTKRQSVSISPRVRGREQCLQYAGKHHVTFSDKVFVHFQSGWSDQDYRNARCSPWRQYAVDRCKFRRRTFKFNKHLGYIFSEVHRSNIRTLIDDNVVVDDVAALAL